MELDFDSVRALSSPTRIQILREVLDQEATTTDLSRELEKSKSTISSHLKTLKSAGLIEKDKKDGRKRVIYRPTRKAEAIVKGKERKVKFSVASTVFTGLLGAVSVARWLPEPSRQAQPSASAAMIADAGQTASNTGSEPGTVFLAAGIVFLGIAIISLLYGLVMHELGD
ncbi:MAG: ArsR/SmtB family transcription factor [Candidatus Nanohaloarchaea archaeon]